MSDNFLDKHTWSEKDWTIYFSNLDMLCRRHNIEKGVFASMIGVKNAYRQAKTKPDPKTIEQICEKFEVSEEWLGNDHGIYQNDIQLQINVKQENNKYDSHGNPPIITIEELTGIPAGMGMGKAVEMLADIYSSKDDEIIKTIYSLLKLYVESIEKKRQKKDSSK